jgi:Rap1a immunity proteins
MQVGSRLPSITVAIAFLVVSGQAQAASPARDLLNGCQSLERGKPRTGQLIHIPKRKGALICWGYMKAMQDLSVWADENGNRILGSCPPERTTTLDLIHSFVRYGRSHRRQLPSNAALAVAKAFQQAFPCDQAYAPPG